jgi:hypothetical protein
VISFCCDMSRQKWANLRCKGDKTNINKYEMCFNETEQRSMLAKHELNFNCCFSSFPREGKDMSADFFFFFVNSLYPCDFVNET